MSRILSSVALAALFAGVGVSAASAATPSTAYQAFATPNPEPQAPGARWGERLAVARDENGDGVNDIFTANPFADLSFPDQGRVYLLSGKDRSILRVIDAPEPQGGTAYGFSATKGAAFGFFISVPGDLNGDGKDDVVVGTDAQNVYTGSGPPCGAPEPNGCNEGQGRAWLFSGATGKVLRVYDNPDPQGTATNGARFGSRIGRAGDVTGDGVPDIIIGASSNDVPAGCGDVTPVPTGCRKDEGQAYIFDGATGALVRRLNLPDADRTGASCSSSCGSLGIAVQGPGDTNGDGVPDQLVDAGSYNGIGRMYVYDGKTGAVRLRIDDPTPQKGAVFGFQDAAPDSPGDVNGDGLADVYANGFLQDGPAGGGQGRAWVFSGKDGALIYAIDDPTPTDGGQFGFSLSRTDYNKDGVPDLYIGQSPHHVETSNEDGGTYIFDGRNAALLKALELPASDHQDTTATNGGPRLGWTNAAPGDLNGDGEPDYMAGAPFIDEAGLVDNGRIYTFLSGTSSTPATTVMPVKLPRVNVAGVTAKVSPARDRTYPYHFTVSGRILRPAGVGLAACKDGRVAVQWKAGGKTVSNRRANLRPDCRYQLSITFRNRRRLGSGRLTIEVRFLGNDRLEHAGVRTLKARVG